MDKQDNKCIPSEKLPTATQVRHRETTQFLPPRVKIGPRMSPIVRIAEKQGMDIQELCRRSNLSRSGIYLKFANDDCKLSDLEKLADALGYNVRFSFKRKYKKTSKK